MLVIAVGHSRHSRQTDMRCIDSHTLVVRTSRDGRDGRGDVLDEALTCLICTPLLQSNDQNGDEGEKTSVMEEEANENAMEGDKVEGVEEEQGVLAAVVRSRASLTS